MYFIKGSWNMIHLYCNSHAEPVEMVLDSGPGSVFYCCPYEVEADGKKQMCTNRVKLTEYEAILGYISDRIVKAELDGEVFNLANVEWKTRTGLHCKVTEHTEREIKVLVTNPKARIM